MGKMGQHPLNLSVRFLLEIAALVSIGMWGYAQSGTWMKFLLAIFLPFLFAIIWGVFAVKDDPSRSGKTVVPTPGIIRLFIEIGLFGFAAWTMFNMQFRVLAWIFTGVLLIHYLVSYDRVLWLIRTTR